MQARSSFSTDEDARGRTGAARRSLAGALMGAVALAGALAFSSGCDSTSSTARAGDDGYVYGTDEPQARQQQRMPMQSTQALAFPTGERASSVLLIEAEGPAESRVGEEHAYKFKVTNLTDTWLHDVALVASDTRNLELRDSGDMQGVGGGAGFTVGDLGPGESRVIELNASPTMAGQAALCLTAQYTPFACLVTNVIQPQLELAIEGPSELLDCDEGVYTIRVSNPGVGAARDVVVRADLPEGLRADGSRNELQKDLGTLEAGESKTLRLRAFPVNGGQYEINAVATADNDLRDEAMVSTVVRVPELALTVNGRNEDYINVPVEYEINVMNEGDGPAQNTIIVANLPSSATFEGASNQGRVENNRVRWNLGTLQPGAQETVRFAVRGSNPGILAANIAAQAYCADRVSSEATATIETDLRGIPALLLEVVDTQDPVRIGTDGNYEITVFNQGSTDATNIVIECELEEAMEFLSGDGPTRVNSDGRTISFAPLATLPAGGSATWEVRVRGIETGDIRFNAQMTADQLTRPVMETESTHLYQ